MRCAASVRAWARANRVIHAVKSLEMVDNNLLSLARDLRARAQEILAKAETTYDTDAERTMREVAARHERLAQRVEQGSGTAGMEEKAHA
jgi:hypothetical protein